MTQCCFPVSRGEQEWSEAAQETSILSLTDQTGFLSVCDTLLLIHTHTQVKEVGTTETRLHCRITQTECNSLRT